MKKESVEQSVKDLFIGVDERHWQKVAASLADKGLLDYSSLNGLEASLIPSEKIISSLQSFLSRFNQTHYQIANVAIEMYNEKELL